MMLLAVVAVFGLLGIFAQPRLTGYTVQEEPELLLKLKTPCFCEEAGNITQQQNSLYCLVESAQNGIMRNQISEDAAISILNNRIEHDCAKCIKLQEEKKIQEIKSE